MKAHIALPHDTTTLIRKPESHPDQSIAQYSVYDQDGDFTVIQADFYLSPFIHGAVRCYVSVRYPDTKTMRLFFGSSSGYQPMPKPDSAFLEALHSAGITIEHQGERWSGTPFPFDADTPFPLNKHIFPVLQSIASALYPGATHTLTRVLTTHLAAPPAPALTDSAPLFPAP